jgi:hypothetical protein
MVNLTCHWGQVSAMIAILFKIEAFITRQTD